MTMPEYSCESRSCRTGLCSTCLTRGVWLRNVRHTIEPPIISRPSSILAAVRRRYPLSAPVITRKIQYISLNLGAPSQLPVASPCRTTGIRGNSARPITTRLATNASTCRQKDFLHLGTSSNPPTAMTWVSSIMPLIRCV